jgi:hypothetical protein
MVHLSVELGMLPSQFMQQATALDMGLLQAFYAARAKADEVARLMAGADASAQDAARKL